MSPASLVVSAVLALPWVVALSAAQLAMPARTPLAAARDSVGSLTSIELRDHGMQSKARVTRTLR